MKTRHKLDRSIRRAFGIPRQLSDQKFMKIWGKVVHRLCKPCWELKYCPYGSYVETMPLLGPTREEAIDHNRYLQGCLRSGRTGDGERLTRSKRKVFQADVRGFDSRDYPEFIPRILEESQCTQFGHICPVFMVAEPITETQEKRRRGRYIPFAMKLRIVRRDNYICQRCAKQLKESELEFDHIIPISRGGSSEESNIQLTCFKCNRGKANRVGI